MNQPILRPIQKEDDPKIAALIRKVLIELGVPKVGTAYADASLDQMYETYRQPQSAYFVIEYNNTIVGGAGIAPLENYDGSVCELQKMYFLEQARGLGLGDRMIDHCLQTAKSMGFDGCYLETMTYMEAAQLLYKRKGFNYIDGPLGNTGHYACPVHMLKSLK